MGAGVVTTLTDGVLPSGLNDITYNLNNPQPTRLRNDIVMHDINNGMLAVK